MEIKLTTGSSLEIEESNYKFDARVPDGPLEKRWKNKKDQLELIAPPNRRNFRVIVVGTGLAGASAAATLGQLGYRVTVFCYQDSPRRAHSIAAQGGINAAKNYQNDNDSTWRLFYETIKGGDYRARESNVYRLAELSVNIIDQAVAQGVPFARDYAGYLDNRSFGGVRVARTFYAKGQTGQQLLLGAYQALMRQVDKGNVTIYPRHEMLDVVLIDGKARGVVVRDLVTGEIKSFAAEAVILATGGYSNVYYLSTNAKGSNATAIWRAHKKGAAFANPCFTQIHPTCIPPSGEYQSKLTLMSESLRNDGRIWVPKKKGDKRNPKEIPENERDYYLERIYPAYGNLVPRDIASRAAKRMCDAGYGVGPNGIGVYLDFSDAIKRLGKEVIEARYGNLFDMYEKITGDSPWEVPMKIYPAPHYTMGGLWVDYHLMSTIPGLFVIGEANFSDHGANRLGASALMQCLADGYFIIPNTIADYLAPMLTEKKVDTDHPEFKKSIENVKSTIDRLLSTKGKYSVDHYHRTLGKIMWDKCGMSRNAKGLSEAIEEIKGLREEYWNEVKVPGDNNELNQSLEKAMRVADFMELAELMCIDALAREESCGGHFREEFATPEGEALRNDEKFSFVSCWFWNGEVGKWAFAKEDLVFEFVKPTVRSYK